ncbi:MAG: hypothetical protein ACXW2U_14625 [Telluria sp.]
MGEFATGGEADDIGEIYSYNIVSLWYRLAFAVPITLIATSITVAGLYDHYQKQTLLPFGFTWLALLAVGGWISRAILINDVRREFATVAIEVPTRVRRNRALVATGIFVVVIAALVFGAPFAEDPKGVSLLLILPVILAYAWALWMTARYRTTRQLTKAAIIEMQRVSTSTTPAAPSKAELLLERLAAIWWVRYLVGIGLLISAYTFAVEGSGKKDDVIIAIALAVWGTYCMREVFGWLLCAVVVGGIFYAIAGALAGIPVSLAIIIGAIIIANSKK